MVLPARLRGAVLCGACVALLAGPAALAFFTGGYFDGPRAWAGLIAWLLVAIAFLFVRDALPRGRAAWLAIGGLALLATWTLVSFTWAPIAGDAYHAGQRVFLYLGVLIAAAVLLREPRARRATEPALALGAVIVIGYGLSERMLPGLLHFSRSVTAQGRLEQPLTYWNAMGELAALGLVLSVRLAGDANRPRWLRALAAAAAAPLGMGLYISFSRGALFAAIAGLIALVVLAPTRAQLAAIGLSVLAAVLAAVAAAPSKSVTTLAGSLATRERDGAITLALLVVIMIAAAVAQWLLAARVRPARLRLPSGAPWIALGLICAGLAIAIVVGAKERSGGPQLRPGVARFVSVQSSRYDYWKVALRAFGDEPLRGVGAGGWAVYWLRYRQIDEFAQDAHSLELQTLAELGVIGGVLLLLFIGGVALAARDAQRLAPSLSAGPIAALVAYFVHSPLDWDWQMPALTLVAIVLTGLIVGVQRPRSKPSEQDSRLSEPARTQTAIGA